MRRSSSLHSIDTFVERNISNDKYQDVVTVADNIDAVTNVNDNITTIAAIGDYVTQITSLIDNIDTILAIVGIEAEIISLESITTEIQSLYTDKSTLDSLYADKAILDSLYSDKTTLDSLFADKATLDSLFADKTVLDSLYADKASLDTLYNNLSSIILVAGSISDINNIADQVIPNITEILQADDNAAIVTALYDLFDDRFLGAIASDPTLDNDGDALVEGTIYWNTTYKVLMVFNGTSWEPTAIQLVDNLTTDDNTKALASSQGVVIGNRLDAIEITFNDTNEPTGFIRAEPLTTGIIEISDDGTIIHRIDSNGIYSTSMVGHNGYDPNIIPGEFYDGTAATARTFQISPVSIADGGDGTYIVYNQGNRIVVNQSQQVQLPATTSLYTIYHNSEGVLDYLVGFDLHSFTDYTITSIIYGNASTGELVIFGDERHGIQMDGMTHRYLHYNEGFRYSSGSDILGLVDGESTFDEITSGVYYDEDIYHTLPAQTEVPTLYISGDEWRVTAHPDLSNDVGYFVDGTVRYNQNLGTDIAPNYSLTAFASGDYMIVFLTATNNATHPYMRMLGQEVYASKAKARAALEDAWSDMHIVPGLPFPEFKPIAAAIINGDGELVELSDGSLFFDLREVGTFGTGSSSASAQYHYDLLGRDTIDSHPATAISYNNTTSGLTATEVQSAVDELDNNKAEDTEVVHLSGTEVITGKKEFSVSPIDIDGEVITTTRGLKNRAINGRFTVARRGDGPFNVANGTYTVDGWANSGGTAVTITREFNSTIGEWGLRVAKDATSFPYSGCATRLDTMRDLAGKPATISFRIKLNSVAPSDAYMPISWRSSSDVLEGTNMFPSFTDIGIDINDTTNIQEASYTFTVPDDATTYYCFKCDILGNQTTGTDAYDFTIYNFQLEAGSEATPFEYLPLGLARVICQRYLWRTETGFAAYKRFGLFIASSTTTGNVTITPPQTMRIKPSSGFQWSGNFELFPAAGGTAVAVTNIAFDLGGSDTEFFTLAVSDSTNSLVDGNSYWLRASNDTTAYLEFSAEL